MRLLTFGSGDELSLTEDYIENIPPYAILSHTWGADSDEVTFKDINDRSGKGKAGYSKIWFCGEQSRKDGLQYFWVDTCCIDKANYTELSEAITSMFRWYRSAVKCYVYLSDVHARTNEENHTAGTWESDFRKSTWFTRGWTLQELIAPQSVEFFSQTGERLGDKRELEQQIHEITGIPVSALRGVPLFQFSVKERMRWAGTRKTKKKEDKAYCLLGIFDVSMSLRYGEGEKEFVRLQKKIDGFSQNLPVASSPPSSTVPFRRDADFVDRETLHGRGTLLGQIEQRCAAAAARVALVGIGGAGKSQLAIEYCHRLRERSPNTWVFWIFASNANRIEQGYREIAERLNLRGRKDPQVNIFELVASWLRKAENETWCLVLDNLDDDAILSIPQTVAIPAGQLRQPLSAYLPQSENGAVLITTRTRHVATKLVEPRDMIIVDVMTDTDAVLLLRKKLCGVLDDHDLEELARTLEYIPLAIVQAAAYIQQKGPRYSVRQYIETFQSNEKRRTSLLKYEAGQLRRDPEAKNSIIITWQISFNDLQEKWPSSADLLSLMSYFDRQGIPKEVLIVQIPEEETRDSPRWKGDGGRHEEDEYKNEDTETRGTSEASGDDAFEEDVDRLRSYSFASISKDGSTFEMHELVQFATRKWLEIHGEDERWRSEFCRKLNAVFPNGDHENWALCDILFPHAKSAERQRPMDNPSVLAWAQILRKAGWYAWAKGDYREAERMCTESVRALSSALGKQDLETTYSLGILATTYADQGRVKEAEKIEVQITDIRRKALGEEHPDTLISMSNLALTYCHQGRWTEAEKIVAQVTEAQRRVLGEEHTSTLISMSNLALIYCHQGRWTEAEKIEAQVTEAQRRVLREEHTSTLISMANLASTYQKQGRWMEAEQIAVQVLEARRRVLGEEHPDTLMSIANLATTYRNQGRWTEAEKMSLQVIATSQRVLGEEHPNTLESLDNLASTYWSQGRWTEAEQIDIQVLEARRRVLGEEHPDTLISMANLATTYIDQRRWIEAEKMLQQVVKTSQRVLGEEHPSTLTSIGSLATTFWGQDRWTEAEQLDTQVVAMKRRVLGEEHPSTLMSIANLASTYRGQGRWTEAEQIHLQILETRRRVLGEEHPDTLVDMANLALTYRNQGRWTESEQMHLQVLGIRRRLLGEEHPDTLTSMHNLAFTLHQQGKTLEAVKLMADCVQIQNRVMGINHPDAISSSEVLAEWQRIE